MTPAVSIREVGKRYKISPTRSSWIKDVLSPGKAGRTHDFWALEDIDLEIEKGATLGILGRNGAGKSTLLKIISGVSQPTTGEVTVRGRLAAIFSTGAGFNPEFTGRENVMLNGLILGIDHDEMLARFDDIAAFADIGEFMDQPIRTYSSGMRSRLGFAVAVNVDSDVLVLDEALSAGDAAFKKKALQRMYDLRDSGTTVLFVSHSLGMVQRFCTDAVLLHKGRLITTGEPGEVVDRYREILDDAGKNDRNDERGRQLDYAIDHEDEEDTPSYGDARTGNARGRAGAARRRGATGEATVLGADLLDGDGRPTRTATPDSEVTVRVHFQYGRPEEESALMLTLRNGAGLDVFSVTTGDGGMPLGPRARGERVSVDFTLGTPLRPGSYSVDAAVLSTRDGGTCLSRAEAATTFEVLAAEEGRPVRGLVRLPARVEVIDRARAERDPRV